MAAAKHGQINSFAESHRTKPVTKVGGVTHVRSADLGDNVARLRPRALTRRTWFDLGDNGTGLLDGWILIACHFRGQGLDCNSKLPALNIAMDQDLIDHGAGHVHGDGKSNPSIFAVFTNDGRVPASSPRKLMRAPPELPGLMDASV